MVVHMKMQSDSGSTLCNPGESLEREPKSNRILAHFPWKIFSVVFAAAYLIILSYYGDVEPVYVAEYFLGQIVFTLIPGMAFAALISVSRDKIRFICLSYFLGIFINIVFYIIVYLIHLQDYLLYVMIAVSALSLIPLYKKRSLFKTLKSDNANAALLSIITAAFLIIILFYTILNNFTPDFTPYTHYYHDSLFNVGNITALYLHLPPQDIRNLGFSFNYHYLYNMFLAIYKNIFGLSSFDLNFKFFAVTQIMLFASSLYIVFSRYIKNVLFTGLAVVLVLLADQYLFAHVMWAAFGTTFGIALCALSLYFFLKYTQNMETAKITDKNFWLGSLFFGMACFAKGPFALVLIAGFGVLLLRQIFKKKNIKVMIIHGLAAVIILGFSFLVVMLNVSGFNGFTKGFATLMTSSGPDYFVWAVNNWGAALSPFMIKFITYPVFLVLNYTSVVTAFVLLLFALIKWRREDIKKEIFLFISIAAGIIMASVITQPGQSNMFFIMADIPFSLLAIVLVLKRYFLSASKTGGKLPKRILLTAVSALLALNAVLCVKNIVSTNGTVLKTYPAAGLTDTPVLNETPNADSISYGEYEGLLWLRDNTPKDAVIAGDRYYYTPNEVLNDARYFYYSAFSERQFYIEGYEYTNTAEKNYEAIINDKLSTMKLVYQNDAAAIQKLKQAGVQYLIRSEYTSASFQLPYEYGDIVFGNNDIVIYKLK
jgi:hypothetical protein